jgi:threonine dehydratase
VVTVSENSISRALVALAERAKLVVEPAGAVAVAAIMDDPSAYPTPATAVISGGNIDPVFFGKVLRHGMAAAGRYLYVGVVIPDLPGGLAALLAEVSRIGANVIDLSHERVSADLGVTDVEVGLQLETRGPDHADQIRTRLAELGYRLVP